MLNRRSLLVGTATMAGVVVLGGRASAESPVRSACGPTAQLQAHPDLSVEVRTRAGWGADEKLRFDPTGKEIWPPEFHRIQTLTLHHSGNVSGVDPAQIIQAIYHNQAVGQKWGDIGYQLLIDWNGVIYEGRFSGADCVPVYPAGGPPTMVNAAHINQYNAGNLGICLLGNLSLVEPTAAALQSLVRLLAVLCVHNGVAPGGTVDYVNPINGLGKRVPAISVHRDWVATECPGEKLVPRLPGIRADVAKLVGA